MASWLPSSLGNRYTCQCDPFDDPDGESSVTVSLNVDFAKTGFPLENVFHGAPSVTVTLLYGLAYCAEAITVLLLVVVQRGFLDKIWLGA